MTISDSGMDIPFTLVQLPGEILLEVMKLLDRPSLLALSATCSKLNLQAHTTPSLWCCLDLNLDSIEHPISSNDPLHSKLKSKGPYARSINISTAQHISTEYSCCEALKLIQQYCCTNSITSLSISHIKFGFLGCVVWEFPALVSLKIGHLAIDPIAFRWKGGPGGWMWDPPCQNGFRWSHHHEALVLSGPDLTESASKLKGLKHFDAKFQLPRVLL